MTDKTYNAEYIVKMLKATTAASPSSQNHQKTPSPTSFCLKTDSKGNIQQSPANAVLLASHFLEHDLTTKYNAVVDSTTKKLKIEVEGRYFNLDISLPEPNRIIYNLFSAAELVATNQMVTEFMKYLDNRKIANNNIKEVHFATFGFMNSDSNHYIHQLPFKKPEKNQLFRCPSIWTDWLQGFTQPQKAEDAIKQFIGAIFTNHRPKKVLYLYGIGGGGKTTLQDALQKYLRKINLEQAYGAISASAFDKDDKNGLWPVRDSAIAFCDDSGKTALYSSEAFKTFITGDSFTTSEKYIAPITTHNRNTLIMTSNRLPLVTSDEAKRRLIILEKTLPKQMITDFADKLADECEQFIKHCIVYYLNTEKENRIDQQRIYTTDTMQEAEDEETAEIEYDLQDFIFTGDSSDKIARGDLFVYINQFRSRIGKKPLESHEKDKMKKFIIKQGCEYKLISINNKKVRGFTGLKFNKPVFTPF